LAHSLGEDAVHSDANDGAQAPGPPPGLSLRETLLAIAGIDWENRIDRERIAAAEAEMEERECDRAELERSALAAFDRLGVPHLGVVVTGCGKAFQRDGAAVLVVPAFLDLPLADPAGGDAPATAAAEGAELLSLAYRPEPGDDYDAGAFPARRPSTPRPPAPAAAPRNGGPA
jgi:hypothetical protein